jgi:hypothetical protein
MTNINEEMQNVNVTISVPVKDIAGLVAINYEELTSKVYDNLDISSITSDVVDEMDSSDLIDKIDMDDLARSFKDQIDISDYIDTDQIASEAADQIDVEDKIHTLLSGYSPSNSCGVGDAATKAMINAIRYDIMCNIYGQDKSKLDVTITDVLRKFIRQEMNIKQEIEQPQQSQQNFTLSEIYQVLNKTPNMHSSLLAYLVDEFNRIGSAKLAKETVVKAD